MPMLYIVNDTRLNTSIPDHVNVNPTSDIYLLTVIAEAIEYKFPDIYEKITQEVVIRRFDGLSLEEFTCLNEEIHKLSIREDVSILIREGLELWFLLIEPLIKNDIRYIYQRYQSRLEDDIEFLNCVGNSLDSVWDRISSFSDDFEERKEAFFILIKELLRRGHLKFQRDMQIIEHSPEEWERIFREVFPNSNSPYGMYDGDIRHWFVGNEECPAYPVWIIPETGEMDWT